MLEYAVMWVARTWNPEVFVYNIYFIRQELEIIHIKTNKLLNDCCYCLGFCKRFHDASCLCF